MLAQRSGRVKAAGGFTLTELVMVMVVIAIIAAIALPRMGNDPVLVSTQAEQLAGDIRYVQSLSMSQGQRYLLRVLSSTTYELEVKGGAQIPHPTGIASPIAFGSAITANPNNFIIGFDGLGIPYTDVNVSSALGSTATITLTRDSATRTVTVSPETGRVFVQ
jgi:prepilin-type N-terminal cleavage/methylation domain-containing protein